MTVITQGDIDAYAEISGDRNPLHIDPTFAAGTPFGSTIAHGHLLVGHIMRALEERYGHEWARRGRLEVKFVAPVFAGQEIAIDIASEGVLTLSVGDRACVLGRAHLAEPHEVG